MLSTGTAVLGRKDLNVAIKQLPLDFREDFECCYGDGRAVDSTTFLVRWNSFPTMTSSFAEERAYLIIRTLDEKVESTQRFAYNV